MKYLFSVLLLSASLSMSTVFGPGLRESEGMYEIGAIDDRDALARYEFERTRDPRTNSIPGDIRVREHDFVRSLSSRSDALEVPMGAADTVLQPDPLQLMQHGIERTGGRTRCLAFDVTNENILVAGAAGGGIWRSVDQGASWTKSTADNYVHSVTALAQDKRPGKQNIWYYGTGELFSTAGYPVYQYDIGCGLFKSVDGAKSWSRLESSSVTRQSTPDSPFHFTTNLATDPSRLDSDVVYAAANGAIVRSNDGGDNWSVVLGTPLGLNSTSWTDVVVTSKGVVYASIAGTGYAGVWRSANGLSWTNISTGSSLGTVSGRVRLAVAPSNSNVVWVYKSSSSSPMYKYTFVSGTGASTGGKWEARNSYISNLLSTQSGYSMSLNVHPTDENTVLVGGTSLYYTTDGFLSAGSLVHVGGYSKEYLKVRSWDPLFPDRYIYDHSHPDMHSAIFMPSNPKKVFLACDGGIFSTNDIGEADLVHWTSMNSNYKAGQFYSVGIDPIGNHDGIIIGGAQDNNSSVGSRSTPSMKWVLGGDGMICDMASKHSAFYPAFQGGQVYRCEMNSSIDSVIRWVNVKPRGGYFDFTAPLKLDPIHDSILYMIGGNAIWRNYNVTGIPYTNDTTSSNTNWRSLSMAAYTSSQLSAIAVCSTPLNRVYVGTKAGSVLRVDSVHNAVAVVKNITSSQFPTSGYVNNVTVDPTDGNNVFVVFSNYGVVSLFHSTDAGVSWEDISGNLEEFDDGTGAGPACRWLEVLHFQGHTLYLVGTTSGVFMTNTLSGLNTQWQQFKAIPNVIVDMIRVRSSDGFIAVATHGLGIYTTYAVLGPAGGIVNSVDEAASPTSLFCAPNPVIETAQLSYHLESDALVSIELWDEQGKMVSDVEHRRMTAGNHELRVDCSQLPRGRYFIRQRIGNSPRWKTLSFIRA